MGIIDFFYKKNPTTKLVCLLAILGLAACSDRTLVTNSNNQQLTGLEIKFLVGSNLVEFCREAASKFNATNPQLEDGQDYYLNCEAKGSGDVVQNVLNLAQNLKSGNLLEEDTAFPTLLSVDGEIYQSQLIYQMNKLFPGQNYIPQITDSPLIAYSPMVLMTTKELASGLEKVNDPYAALVDTKNHQQLDSNAAAIPITYVHTAPTRSNSGLQTLVAQFASIAGKKPEELTIADVEGYQDRVKQIQSKITRYGKSTSSLAQSMVNNGLFWASVGSVYESSVIEANSNNNHTTNNLNQYQAVYPEATFSSNIRVILPDAPWISDAERAAAREIIDYIRTPEIQAIAVNLGLRPGVPGVALDDKFSSQFGVVANPRYESYRAPDPEVVESMLESWQNYAKKESQIVILIDTSGSMEGAKLAAVQNTLYKYIRNLGTKESIALISFNSAIDEPIIVDGSAAGKEKGIKFIGSLNASGGTRLYDSSLYARNWLQNNLRADAINAVLVLTDGENSQSKINLNMLERELAKTNFNSDARIAFFTVGYGNRGEFKPQVLQQIANLNGGYYRQGSPETINNLMADLQVEF
ncbi:extracellular solute-binding protein [Myxosarcina sp. GI1(2024)]